MTVVRYGIAALIGFVLLLGVMLLVRPLIFSVAPPRDDSGYAVAAQSELAQGPILRELPLNASHDLPGERVQQDVPTLRIVISRQPSTQVAVVDAWSPTNDCAVEIAVDRLRDCTGDAWTFAGVPLDASDAPLVRFPAHAAAGAIIVDFTKPFPAS